MTGPPDSGLGRARRALAAHRDRLLALPHVVAVGIGRPDPDGPHDISVMTDRPVHPPPVTEVDGVPVRWTVTGGFRTR